MVMLDDEEDEDDWWEQMSRGYEPLPMPADTQSALDSLGMEVELNLPEDYDLSIGEQQEYAGPPPGTFELDEPEPPPQAAPFADTPLQAAPQQPYSYPSYAAEPGNVDLSRRPHVQNPDGSTSTVRSMGVNIDGKEYLIPTVSDDGRVMGDDEAVETFKRTGKHLGVYSSPEESTRAGTDIHHDQERNPPAPMAAAQGALPAPGEIETTPKEWAAAANASTAQPAPYNEGTEVQQQPALQAPPPAAAPPAQADKTPGEAAAAAVGKQADDKKAQNQEGSFWGPLAELGRADNAWVLASISDLLLNKGRGVGQIMGAEAQRAHQLRIGRARGAADAEWKRTIAEGNLAARNRGLNQADERMKKQDALVKLRQQTLDAKLAELRGNNDPNSEQALALKRAIVDYGGATWEQVKDLTIPSIEKLGSLIRQESYLKRTVERNEYAAQGAAERERAVTEARADMTGLLEQITHGEAKGRETAATEAARKQTYEAEMGRVDANEDLVLRKNAQQQAEDFARQNKRALEITGLMADIERKGGWAPGGVVERALTSSRNIARVLAGHIAEDATVEDLKRLSVAQQKVIVLEMYLRDLTGAAATDPELVRMRDQLGMGDLTDPEVIAASAEAIQHMFEGQLAGAASYNAPAYDVLGRMVGWDKAGTITGATRDEWMSRHGDRVTRPAPPGYNVWQQQQRNPSAAVGQNPDSKVNPPAPPLPAGAPPGSTPTPDGAGYVEPPGTPDGMKWIVLERPNQAPSVRPVTLEELEQLKAAGKGTMFKIRDATPDEIRRTRGR